MNTRVLTALPAFALTGFLAFGAAQDEARYDVSGSSHTYPVETTALNADPEAKPTELEITGTGLREKTMFNVNVYSYALYVEPAKAREKLAKWKGKKLKPLQKDDALYAALADDEITKELRLKFCRNVDADDVKSAFEDSLEPRVLEYLKKEKGTDKEKLTVVQEFRALFTLDKVKDGAVLRFAMYPGGKLHTSIDGEVQKVLESKALCWALIDVYAGKKPISKSGKKKLIGRLPEILKGE